jgi:hypothetical protein
MAFDARRHHRATLVAHLVAGSVRLRPCRNEKPFVVTLGIHPDLSHYGVQPVVQRRSLRSSNAAGSFSGRDASGATNSLMVPFDSRPTNRT